ncbi:hypothetical protein HanIR_Chr08g0355001 [Helianthus annuus]|nr:hypothetical protein HanIR_Chr08g0355001 [Helianthus annuus]
MMGQRRVRGDQESNREDVSEATSNVLRGAMKRLTSPPFYGCSYNF